jgi:hypothetical protein
MNITEILKELEKCIGIKLDEIALYGRQAKNNSKHIQELQEQNDKIHLKMAAIVKELEPIECIVIEQRPEMKELLNQLKILVKE